jgi:quercetin dioxygenase-like cupin family protein
MPRPARPTLVAGVLAATFATTTLVAVAALGAAPATATPPVGPPSSSPSPVPEATSTEKLVAHADGVHLKIPKDGVVRDFTLTYRPGSSSGWHEHPGLVLATVVSGTVSRTTPCRAPEEFTAGQVFVEVGPHLVQNRGTQDAVLSITQIAPAGTTGAAFREDLPAPVCRPHHPQR